MIRKCDSCKHKISCADKAEMYTDEFLRLAEIFDWIYDTCADYEKEE